MSDDTRFGRIKDYYRNAENRSIPGLTSELVKDDTAYLIETAEQARADIDMLKAKVALLLEDVLALRIEKADFYTEVAILLGRLAKESQDRAVERDALNTKVWELEGRVETFELGYRGFP